MHAIESELIKACDFKPRKKYADRQEYLRAIMMAANKLDEDEFENLSDEAAAWLNACVTAHNSSKNNDIPDFDEASDGEEDEAADESEADEDDEAEDDEAEDDEADEADESEEDTDDDDGSDSDDDEADDSSEVEDDSEEDEVEAKPAKKAKTPAKPAPKVKPVSAAKKPAKKPSDDEEVPNLDKWGCFEGSKNAMALAMFEKGATAKEVKEKLGGTYYNVLGKMVQNGHKLEKSGHMMKLTHKDDLGKPAPKKSKK